MFRSMHESLLSTTGLIDAAEMAGLVQHLPGFTLPNQTLNEPSTTRLNCGKKNVWV